MLYIDQATENSFEDLGSSVVIYDELISGISFDDFLEVPADIVKRFKDEFEVVGQFPGDPSEDYYQGMTFTHVIKRKSDGELYGFKFWEDISKYGGPFLEVNGTDYGFDYDVPDGFNWEEDYYPQVYVFLPVKEFSVKGYEVSE